MERRKFWLGLLGLFGLGSLVKAEEQEASSEMPEFYEWVRSIPPRDVPVISTKGEWMQHNNVTKVLFNGKEVDLNAMRRCITGDNGWVECYEMENGHRVFEKSGCSSGACTARAKTKRFRGHVVVMTK